MSLLLPRRRYDGTVRNSAGDVVQFLYGEDGMDAVRIEGQVRRRKHGAKRACVAERQRAAAGCCTFLRLLALCTAAARTAQRSAGLLRKRAQAAAAA